MYNSTHLFKPILSHRPQPHESVTPKIAQVLLISKSSSEGINAVKIRHKQAHQCPKTPSFSKLQPKSKRILREPISERRNDPLPPPPPTHTRTLFRISYSVTGN